MKLTFNSVKSFFKNPEHIVITFMIVLIIFSVVLIMGVRAGGLSQLFFASSSYSSSMRESQNQLESSSSSSASSQLESQSSSVESKAGMVGMFAQAVANGSPLGEGLNWRETPCGKIKGQSKVWGSIGTILQEGQKATCGGTEYTFVEVAWEDGTTGWSALEFLTISQDKPASGTGSISGLVDYPSEFIPKHKVCAIEMTTKAQFCDVRSFTITPDTLAQTGTYTINVPKGVYYVFMELLEIPGDVSKAFFTECSYTQSTLKGEERLTLCNSDKPVNAVKVYVDGGEKVKGIAPFDWGRSSVVLRDK